MKQLNFFLLIAFARLRWFGYFATLLVLSACGGGGGTATEPELVFTGPRVTVQGNVTYQRVGFTARGALDYNNISSLPVRGANVELLFGDRVVATVPTSDTGQYVFSAAPSNVALSVRVRAETKQTVGPAQWDVSVRDNTNANALYTLQSPVFNSGLGQTQNLLATSGWGGSSYTGTRAAGPFAILDTIYESQRKVLSVQADAKFPLLKVFWSINNNTTGNGQIPDGDIGNSFFTFLSDGDSVVERQIYLLGRANDDTDEYDGSLIAHEWGHYYQSVFSRDNSPGQRHGSGDNRLDRRVAFSEGWGNAFSGIVLSRNTYFDSSGPNQGSAVALPLNVGYNTAFGGNKGWYREFSIQYILWSLSNQAGFQSVHQALTSNAFRSSTALTDIHVFADSYRSIAAATQSTALNALLSSESITTNSDAFGNNETNSGGSALTLPYYRQITALGSPVSLLGGQTLCTTALHSDVVNSIRPEDSDRNRLGQFVYARFTLPTTGVRTITVSATPGAGVDTDFELYRAGKRVLEANIGEIQTETISQSLVAGEYVLAIHDFNKVFPQNTCFTVSIQ
jgi:hypothetical protein